MHTRVLFAACLATVVAASRGAEAKPLLIVSAEAGGDVVVIDLEKTQIVERIKVGARPRGLKASRDGKKVVVALAGQAKGAPVVTGVDPSAGVAVIDIPGRKVAKKVVTPPAPFGVDLLPDGKTAYLSSTDTNEILAVDLDAGAVKKKAPVGAVPQGVATRPDGKVVYVASHGSDEVWAMDAKAVKLIQRIDAGSRPQAVVFAPRGDTAVAVDEGLPTLTVIDAKANAFTHQFVLPGLANLKPAPALQSAVFSPDGKLLYVTTGPGRSVLIVDLAKKAVVGTIDGTGWFPRGIAISRDGKKLYTANGPSNDVSIIDVKTKKIEGRVEVPGAPWGVVFLP